jgi:hypothetical protein
MRDRVAIERKLRDRRFFPQRLEIGPMKWVRGNMTPDPDSDIVELAQYQREFMRALAGAA